MIGKETRMHKQHFQKEMKKPGFLQEAEWWHLICNWYAAVDLAGIDIDERIAYLMDMREFLLKQYNLMIFPPPCSYVNNLPIAQFEGILTNVDRRLQLYSMVQTEANNHRSLSSHDKKTFVSPFQVHMHFLPSICNKIYV